MYYVRGASIHVDRSELRGLKIYFKKVEVDSVVWSSWGGGVNPHLPPLWEGCKSLFTPPPLVTCMGASHMRFLCPLSAAVSAEKGNSPI